MKKTRAIFNPQYQTLAEMLGFHTYVQGLEIAELKEENMPMV
tara:strand:+ start:445 stop:570 length:126 start_codon:yes stop_codon:yes gene_type:complete